MIVGALHLATMTNAELAAHGVPASGVTSERERMTGHVRRVQPRWAKSIGLWGGVADILTIAEHVGVTVEAAREYAKQRGLRWRTKKRAHTPAQLGVLAMATPGTSREAAARLGLLPIECCMYRSAITEVLVYHCTTLSALLRWSPADLEHAWEDLELRIEAPEPERPAFHDRSYLARIVAEAERRLAAHPEEDEP
jgi:hypothetical protein